MRFLAKAIAVSMALAFALVATASFAAGGSDSDDSAAAADKKYVTDPTNGKVYTAPEYGGTLTYGSSSEPPNSDAMVGDIAAGAAASGVVEKLGIANWGIDRSVNDLANEILLADHFTGALAESWDIPNPTTYIFHIRQGVRWHDKAPMNGRELTAEDVVYNIARWRTSDKNTRYPAMTWESVTATDRYTVEVRLVDPPLDALLVLIEDSMGFVNAPEVIEQHGDVADWRNLVGTGPFMLTDWVDGSAITWVKNPDYWGHDEKYPENRLPYIDELVRLIMPDQATRISAMRTGQIDYLGHNSRRILSDGGPDRQPAAEQPRAEGEPVLFSGGGERCLQRDQATLRRHPRAPRHTDGGRPRNHQHYLLQGLDAARTHGDATARHRICDSVC